MALFYQAPKKTSVVKSRQARILDLDYQGYGVAKIDGKTWFIENALPDELVNFVVKDEKRQYGFGVANKILQTSSQRVTPNCSYYQQCGGCQTQHINLDLLRQTKQQSLFNRLQKLQSEPIQLMPMLVGNQWHYRRRLRLSLNVNPKTKRLDIGFRRQKDNEIINIQHCLVAEPEINALLPDLIHALRSLPMPKLLGHIELVSADNGVAMLLRHRQKSWQNLPPSLAKLATDYRLNLFVQDDEKIQLMAGEQPYYQLQDLKLYFDIRDFIQVNTELNQQMVTTALDWLDLQNSDRVLDLFSGMGNFTLPISRKVQQVIGIEGVDEMVKKAEFNANQNQCQNVQFYRADLAQPFINQIWAEQQFDKLLLDPPRAGADFTLNGLAQLNIPQILYISCNPATLVRDAEILQNQGYLITQMAMIDMFPNTAHLESMTLFKKR